MNLNRIDYYITIVKFNNDMVRIHQFVSIPANQSVRVNAIVCLYFHIYGSAITAYELGYKRGYQNPGSGLFHNTIAGAANDTAITISCTENYIAFTNVMNSPYNVYVIVLK